MLTLSCLPAVWEQPRDCLRRSVPSQPRKWALWPCTELLGRNEWGMGTGTSKKGSQRRQDGADAMMSRTEEPVSGAGSICISRGRGTEAGHCPSLSHTPFPESTSQQLRDMSGSGAAIPFGVMQRTGAHGNISQRHSKHSTVWLDKEGLPCESSWLYHLAAVGFEQMVYPPWDCFRRWGQRQQLLHRVTDRIKWSPWLRGW